jgi:hypothetical protein
LVLRDADDHEISIPLKSIEERSWGGSLMPEGLADSLTRAELLHLVRFLSELGKVGPYSVSKERIVRRWQVLEATGPGFTALARTSFATAAIGDPALTWSPAYSTVAGILPLDDLPRLGFRRPTSPETDHYIFLRFQLEVSAASKAKLVLNSVANLQAWLDGEPTTVRDEMVLDLQPGGHTVTFVVNTARRREPVRCALAEGYESSSHVRVVGGK